MNYPMIARTLGLLLAVLSACLGAVAAYGWVVDLHYGVVSEHDAAVASLMATGVGLVIAGGLWVAGRRLRERGSVVEGQLQRRDAFVLTGVGWLLAAVIAALPFWFWAMLGGADGLAATEPFFVDAVNGTGNVYVVRPGHEFASFASCYFEAVSGLTTTGATVLGERGGISELPRTLLLWRSLTHWLGGLGIVVLFVAVMPSIGIGAKRLFQSESSAQDGGVRPRIGETARVLWIIYLTFTASALLIFRACGMSWFDATNHAFSVLATGGYSTQDASVGHFDRVWIDVSTIAFMLIAGTNFTLFYRVVRGNWRGAFSDREWQVFIMLKVVVTAIVMFNLWGRTITTTAGVEVEGTLLQSLRYASFQVASLQTGTGFATADWDDWPATSLVLLFGLMFIGGSAGSTAGGVKVIRTIIMLKVFADAIERSYRPNVVRPVKVGGVPVDEGARRAVVTFLLMWGCILMCSSFFLVIVEPSVDQGGRMDAATSLVAPLVTLGNVGPGLYEVGAVKHFGWFTAPSKYLMCLLMVLGRLELFALLALFSPRFWRAN